VKPGLWFGLILCVVAAACGSAQDSSDSKNSDESAQGSVRPPEKYDELQTPDPDTLTDFLKIDEVDTDLEKKRKEAQEKFEQGFAKEKTSEGDQAWVKNAQAVRLLEISIKDKPELTRYFYLLWDPKERVPIGVALKNKINEQDCKNFCLADLSQRKEESPGALVYRHEDKYDVIWLYSSGLKYDGGELKLTYATSLVLGTSLSSNILTLRKTAESTDGPGEWVIEATLEKNRESGEKSVIQELIFSAHSSGLNPAEARVGDGVFELLKVKN
jgi:hypothetical protein